MNTKLQASQEIFNNIMQAERPTFDKTVPAYCTNTNYMSQKLKINELKKVLKMKREMMKKE